MSMDIYAKSGVKVKFVLDQRQGKDGGVNNDLLTLNEVYIVERTDVHGWHTNVYLREFPGKNFNSVCFETVEEKKKSKDGFFKKLFK